MKEQLYKKHNGEYSKIFPLNYIQNLIDSETGNTLASILQTFNNIYIPYQDNSQDTRNFIPESLRRKGLWITYNNGEDYITEYYKGNANDIQEYWAEDYNWEIVPNLKYVQDNASKLPDGIITADKFSPALLQLIQSSGKVVNMADDEDIEEVNSTLKFKDRKYNFELASGKGYKILRKNWIKVGGRMINLLTQDMINEANTVYEIRYDFDLNDETINIPKGCVLKFEGGSITNGIVNSIETIINKYNFNCVVKGYIYNINGKRFSNNGVFIYNTDVELQMSISDFSDEWMYENFEFLENIGISDVVLCPQLVFDSNYNISYRYNNAKFENITKIINKYSINIVGIKFHQQTGFDKTVQNEILARNWTEFLKQEINKYSTINTLKYVYIINENNDWAKTDSIYIPYILEINNYIKDKGLTSCISYVNSYRLSLVDKQFSEIGINALNYYPTLSFMDENAYVDEAMINKIRKDVSEYIYIAKTVFGNTIYGISETGTMNKVKSLRFPWETNLINTGDTSNTNIPLHVYYDAFFAGIQGINNLKFINLFFISPYNNRERQDILINQLKKYNYVV